MKFGKYCQCIQFSLNVEGFFLSLFLSFLLLPFFKGFFLSFFFFYFFSCIFVNDGYAHSTWSCFRTFTCPSLSPPPHFTATIYTHLQQLLSFVLFCSSLLFFVNILYLFHYQNKTIFLNKKFK